MDLIFVIFPNAAQMHVGISSSCQDFYEVRRDSRALAMNKLRLESHNLQWIYCEF